MNARPADRLSRARGALLGQAAGDALGTTVEFQPSDEIARRHPDGVREIVGGGPFSLLPGQVTDDTELALALARSLVDRRGFELDDLARAYLRWYRSEPFDIGGTTAQAFGPLAESEGMAQLMFARASQQSQANGSLMRQSPLAIFGWSLPAGQLAKQACLDSSLSHPHPACQEACVALTHAIALAIRTGSSAQVIYDSTMTVMRQRPDAAGSGVLRTLEAAAREIPEDFYQQMGWVLKALQNAFYRLLHAPDLATGVIQTVSLGGDTDTNACIAGALLGAVHGLEAIPQQWVETVLGCSSPRPAEYHCADLLELAELLLAINPAPADGD